MSESREDVRQDVEASLATRAELGPGYDEQIAAGLADRVEQLVAYRTAELRAQSGGTKRELAAEQSARHQRLVLGIASLAAGIPITAIAGYVVDPGLAGVLVGWAGIVGVNVAHAVGWRRRS